MGGEVGGDKGQRAAELAGHNRVEIGDKEWEKRKIQRRRQFELNLKQI